MAGIQRLQRQVSDLADPNGRSRELLFAGVKEQGMLLLKQEYATSTSATGDQFAPTVRGTPALVSKKLPNAWQVRVDQGVIRFIGRVNRDWLTAVQAGHVFDARKVAANAQYVNFNSRGKMVAERRIFNKKGELRRGAYQRYLAGHTVGRRVLPPRPMVPIPTATELPPLWEAATKAGLAIGMQRWAGEASK